MARGSRRRRTQSRSSRQGLGPTMLPPLSAGEIAVTPAPDAVDRWRRRRADTMSLLGPVLGLAQGRASSRYLVPITPTQDLPLAAGSTVPATPTGESLAEGSTVPVTPMGESTQTIPSRSGDYGRSAVPLPQELEAAATTILRRFHDYVPCKYYEHYHAALEKVHAIRTLNEAIEHEVLSVLPPKELRQEVERIKKQSEETKRNIQITLMGDAKHFAGKPDWRRHGQKHGKHFSGKLIQVPTTVSPTGLLNCSHAEELRKLLRETEGSRYLDDSLERMSVGELALAWDAIGKTAEVSTTQSPLPLPLPAALLAVSLDHLGGSNNGGRRLTDVLFAKDKYDMGHRTHGLVELCLSRDVFEADGGTVDTETRLKLMRVLYPDNKGEEYLSLRAASLHTVTLSAIQRLVAQVPPEAIFCAWCNPVDLGANLQSTKEKLAVAEADVKNAGASLRLQESRLSRYGPDDKIISTKERKQAQERRDELKERRDELKERRDELKDELKERRDELERLLRRKIVRDNSLVKLLTTGGFVYFDDCYNTVAISALSFDASPHFKPPELPSQSIIYFSSPATEMTVEQQAMIELEEWGRWWPVTATHMLEKGLTHFAWINPCEIVGGFCFPKLGGFAYVQKDEAKLPIRYTKSSFLPVIHEHERVQHNIHPIDESVYIEGLSSKTVSTHQVQGHTDRETHKFHHRELHFEDGVHSALGLHELLCVEDQQAIKRASQMDDSTVAILNEVKAAATTEDIDATAEDIKNAQYVIEQEAKEEKVAGNDGDGTHLRERDAGHGGMKLDDFWQHERNWAGHKQILSRAEVAALRLYTTSTFRLINRPLRRQTEGEEKTHLPLPVTTHFIETGLKKLRACEMKRVINPLTGRAKAFKPKVLWRGVKNTDLEDLVVGGRKYDFMHEGGTESACLSTTEDMRVMAAYAQSESPLVFRIKVDTPMEMGADIEWLSTFPHEREILYPPLTYLKPLMIQHVRGVSGGKVITVKPSFPS